MTRWRVHAKWGALLLILVWGAPGFSQQPDYDVRQEIETLKQGQEDIRKQLQEIKGLLQRRRPARRQAPNVRGMVFNLGDNPAKGAQTAKLTLIEFTDYQ